MRHTHRRGEQQRLAPDASDAALKGAYCTRENIKKIGARVWQGINLGKIVDLTLTGPRNLPYLVSFIPGNAPGEVLIDLHLSCDASRDHSEEETVCKLAETFLIDGDEGL